MRVVAASSVLVAFLAGCAGTDGTPPGGAGPLTAGRASFAGGYPTMFVRGTNNGWGTTAMTLVADHEWQASATFGSGSSEAFKLDAYANWATNWGDNDRDGIADPGGANIPIAGGAGSYVIRFNDATRVYSATRGFASSYPTMYLRGTCNGWDATAMQLVADHLWQIDAAFGGAADERFKLDAYANWATNWGDNDRDGVAGAGEADIPITGGAGSYQIRFDDSTRVYAVTKTGGDTTPPSVRVTSPAAGATVAGVVTATADASDDVGVTLVELYAGDAQVASATTAPYRMDWDTTAVADGTVVLTARAHDAAGNVATSAGVAVTVSNASDAGLTVHVKRPPSWGTALRIHYWNVVPSSIDATVWPGAEMTPEGRDWYRYTIAGATSASLVFNDGAGHQTADLSRTGEGWYGADGQWTDADPEPPLIPTVAAAPAPGIYLAAQSVALSGSNEDDVIYYTIDGTTPTPSSARYAAPIVVGASMTIRALGVNRAGQAGAVASFAYTIDPDADLQPPAIASSRAEGHVDPGATVAFTVRDDRPAPTTATYTTDGSTPTSSSPVYVQGDASAGLTGASIAIAQAITFRFLVVDGAGNRTTASFRFDTGAPDRNDFRRETIYFVITTRFFDGDPSNNVHCWDDAHAGNPDDDPCWRGDFEGLIEKLDYIKALGFSAVWITPVVKNASGYDYHGYHAINFRQVDPRYATWSRGETAEQSYQRLIDEAHARGMKIIQDVVVNHSSNFGEENLFPMFRRNAPTALDETITTALTELPNPWLPAGYDDLSPTDQFQARLSAMKEDASDTTHVYHHEKSLSWEGYTVQTGQIAGDCVDLNTENPTVQQYLVDAYDRYIDMGVDAFRVDTVKHVSRLDFNRIFIPAWKQRGGEDFFVFGEVCSRYRQVWNNNIPAISAPFYTWAESVSYPWGDRETNEASVFQNWNDNQSPWTQPTSDNHILYGNAYHAPDWSRRSGLGVIDFPMHWNFANARDAFGIALSGDQTYADATFNVTYVDSHDYAPDTAPETERFALPQDTWAENLSLMFTFRGIPTIFYGSEIEFQKGRPLDVGPNAPLSTTGRAYFGDHITGSVTVTGFGQYSAATGNMATTLSHPLAQHIRRLNLIRRAIPALQMGEYSVEGVSGPGMAFKRRYTSGDTDSFALVTVSGDATFDGIPDGTYVDAVTGDRIAVTGGSLHASCAGKGNARIYVLGGPGQIGEAGAYLH